ncbi:MAG TPA: zinc-ribbon and DUF3426 domain-containing protein [Burkholderiales bacterium]|nr:zinc-ribbon and DUF3426 domain-containing protein [Burkholderiales bacterium]
MSLITRCPACGTAFRVRREQLATHFGSVRCGKCDNVFNGVTALVEEGGEGRSSDFSPQVELLPPSPPPRETTRTDDEERLPNFMAPAAPARRRAWIWALATAVAAVLLAAQVGYRYRAEIATLMPATRAPLLATCQWLGCKVALPRRAEVLSIESSDLQADPRRQNVIVLHALIRNRSRLPQQYPALELTLTDEGGQPVLRRVLLPSDYVELERVSGGIAAGGEAALRVYLDSSGAPVTSYRLYLFYPT